MVKNRTVKDIAWLAGLLEGEGCFDYANDSPRIKLKMNDNDVVNRVAAMFNREATIYQNGKDYPKSRISETSCRGKIAIGWMLTIYSFMGNRRKDKIKEIVIKYSLAGRAPSRKVDNYEFT